MEGGGGVKIKKMNKERSRRDDMKTIKEKR